MTQKLADSTKEIMKILGSVPESEIARDQGLTRQRVHQIKQQLGNLTIDQKEEIFGEEEYQDTGCADGYYPSCLKCPAPSCREDKLTIEAKHQICYKCGSVGQLYEDDGDLMCLSCSNTQPIMDVGPNWGLGNRPIQSDYKGYHIKRELR